MSHRKIITMAALAAILSLMAPAAHADDRLERLQQSCRVMTGKFVAQSIVVFRWKDTDKYGRLKNRVVSDQEMDDLLMAAYGIKQAEMDKKWPGFWSWSAGQVRRALSMGLTFQDMQRLGEMECIVRFNE